MSVVHAVPDAAVDVYVDGDAVLEDFQPGTVSDTLTLPAGSYDLKVTEAGAGADAEALVEAEGVDVPAGANASVVAHLDAEGDPALTPFVNDTSRIDAGDARLTVRHTAAAPEVDVRADGEAVIEGLSNPDEETLEVGAGTISADVVLAGTDDVVIGPADLDLAEGDNTVVYAWGSAEDENLDLIVQVIDGMGSAPEGVPGGTGGAADGSATWTAVAALLGLAGAAVIGYTLRERFTLRRRV
ncbi:DUF4397 domain-containing protein [Nocardiopsis lambiniae]|uniref:DUF4397 domain-containing protein n=1 Tax=Nocardiopsis lambiniae TaxID=3075539 RepID=A0ABU2MD12_9ACTN|nr:DUF4397 domain-containing protein [Nocardiopsis sp. DSM 44743]MDT0329811.1 DUF4397 domain-containing protein [Nocardiopsis sp. DSM 44743]